MKRVLITGAGGQLGQDCAMLLGRERREDLQVMALGSAELDIGDAAAVERTVSSLEPQVVINCAAYTKVDLCESETAACFRVNALGPEHLARALAPRGGRLIHVSTDYVFPGDRPPPAPYTEDDEVGPVSAYGRSKLEGEERAAALLDDLVILRTAWLYGMGGHNFLKTMLRLALEQPGRTLRVVDDQHGSLTWTRTLAAQIARIIETDLRGVVHATAAGHGTWFQAARLFLHLMEVPVRVEPCTTADYPTPARRPANSILENARLKALGMDVMRPWDEDLRAFARGNAARLRAECGPQEEA